MSRIWVFKSRDSSSFSGDLGEVLGIFQGLRVLPLGTQSWPDGRHLGALSSCEVVALWFRMQQLPSTQDDPPVPRSPSVCLVLLCSPGLWTQALSSALCEVAARGLGLGSSPGEDEGQLLEGSLSHQFFRREHRTMASGGELGICVMPRGKVSVSVPHPAS